MKKLVIIDDCLTSKCEIFESILNTCSVEEAIEEARREWEHLSEYDRNHCFK